MKKKTTVENVTNVPNLTEERNSILSSEELFNVEGGEDVDLDEDCYTQQCVILASLCVNVSTACVLRS